MFGSPGHILEKKPLDRIIKNPTSICYMEKLWLEPFELHLDGHPLKRLNRNRLISQCLQVRNEQPTNNALGLI